MARFRYQVASADGKVETGVAEAETREALIARFHKMGQTPIRVDAVASNGLMDLLQTDVWGGNKVPRRAVTSMTRELATLLGAGLALDGALKLMAEISENKAVKAMLERIRSGLRGGSSLADALAAEAGVFPRDYISMVRAGEAGGALNDVFDRLATYRERADEFRSTVQSALIYPMILLLMAGFTVILLITVVVPRFRDLFENAGEALPLATRVLMSVGEAVSHYGGAAFLILIAAALWARWWYGTPSGRRRWDRHALGWPAVGKLLLKAETARFGRTLGALLSGGVPMLGALDITRETMSNAELSARVATAAAQVKDGDRLTKALAELDVVPTMALRLLQVGDETGQLVGMLHKVADLYDKEVQRDLNRVIAILVPAVTVTLGLLIAGIIGSILVAILRINELAQ